MSTEEVVSAGFSPTPSLDGSHVAIGIAPVAPGTATVLGIPVGEDGDVPPELGVDRERLAASGFDARVGATLTVPTPADPTIVAVGIGDGTTLDAAALRNAAAAFARAASSQAGLAPATATTRCAASPGPLP